MDPVVDLFLLINLEPQKDMIYFVNSLDEEILRFKYGSMFQPQNCFRYKISSCYIL